MHTHAAFTFPCDDRDGGPVHWGPRQPAPPSETHKCTDHTEGQRGSVMGSPRARVRFECRVGHLPKDAGQVLSLPAVRWANSAGSALQGAVGVQWDPRAVPGHGRGRQWSLEPQGGQGGVQYMRDRKTYPLRTPE